MPRPPILRSRDILLAPSGLLHLIGNPEDGADAPVRYRMTIPDVVYAIGCLAANVPGTALRELELLPVDRIPVTPEQEEKGRALLRDPRWLAKHRSYVCLAIAVELKDTPILLTDVDWMPMCRQLRVSTLIPLPQK